VAAALTHAPLAGGNARRLFAADSAAYCRGFPAAPRAAPAKRALLQLAG
jgi:hypothetical protein